MRVLHVAGARPNFMKLAPVLRALDERSVENILVHTGQHYDHNMSAAFFEDLELPDPDVYLDVGSGSHAVQTARVMERIEPVLVKYEPDWTVVYGDVNSTLAAALVASKLGLKIAHVEAGLRSFDRTMPEEINRMLTDQVSDLLFTTSPEAEGNLLREGVAGEKIHFVGNPMIDSLERVRTAAEKSNVIADLRLDEYALVTLHRPSNVDAPGRLAEIVQALRDIAKRVAVVFPAHPRTAAALNSLGAPKVEGIRVLPPLNYSDFLRLQMGARVVVTDSGGIQEEATVLGVPCLTFRDNTERPVTCTAGTNRVIGANPNRLFEEVLSTLHADGWAMQSQARPILWDGRAGTRIAAVLSASDAARMLHQSTS